MANYNNVLIAVGILICICGIYITGSSSTILYYNKTEEYNTEKNLLITNIIVGLLLTIVSFYIMYNGYSSRCSLFLYGK